MSRRRPRTLLSALGRLARDRRVSAGIQIRACELLMVVHGFKLPAPAAPVKRGKPTKADREDGARLRRLLHA